MTRLHISSFLLLAACASGTETETVTSDELDSAISAQNCDYPMALGTSSHTGKTCAVSARSGLHVIAKIAQDVDADAQAADNGGILLTHESPALTSGDWLIVPSREGYADYDYTNVRFSIQAWKWTCSAGHLAPCVGKPGSTLVHQWDYKTDWRPVESASPSYSNGYPQGFYPAIADGSVFVPAASGKLRRVNLTTGALTATVDPFAGTAYSGDPLVVGVSGITVDSAGRALYTATAIPLDGDRAGTPRESWVVRVDSSNTATIKPWSAIATTAIGIPAATDTTCLRGSFETGYQFSGPNDHGNTGVCGPQRPALNAAPAIKADGRVIVLTHSNVEDTVAFLVELDGSTLAPVRSMDLRGHGLWGCGVREPIQYCKTITAGGTTNIGYDPYYNAPVAFRGWDLMDNHPFINPNGDVGVGGYDYYYAFAGEFDSRGGIFVFGNGTSTLAAKNQEFGWEVTPSVFTAANGSWSYLQDRNFYSDHVIGLAQYSPTFGLQSKGDALQPKDSEWIDFLDANVLSDSNGNRYGVNGDGHLYAFNSAGTLLETVTLTNDDGSLRSMETLSGYGARDAAGRLIVSYAGSIYVIEGSGTAGAIDPRVIADPGVKRTQSSRGNRHLTNGRMH